MGWLLAAVLLLPAPTDVSAADALASCLRSSSALGRPCVAAPHHGGPAELLRSRVAVGMPFRGVADAGGGLLVSRPMMFEPIVLPDLEPASFDLIDFLEEQQQQKLSYHDVEHRSIFVLKKHVGIASGYDNGILHGSLGMYLTVAEVGRWNFGVMAPEIGLARYTVFDERRRQAVTKTDYTIFISLASIHYRVGYLPSIGMNWYVNLEQVFDVRANLPGSQIGISFSSK